MSNYERPFEYTRKWYEDVYHAGGDYRLTERTFEEVQGEWDAKKHHKRFTDFLDAWGYDLNGKTCIDIGCHHGKSIAWCYQKYPDISVFMGVDFSKVAIDWCREQFPKKYKTFFDCFDVEKLGDEMALMQDYFDVVFCIDMIEHLPEKKYRGMIKGIKEIVKPGGKIVCQIGKTNQPEHIHIISDEQAIDDFGLNVIGRYGEYFVMEK